jgi:hypothetical protein
MNGKGMYLQFNVFMHLLILLLYEASWKPLNRNHKKSIPSVGSAFFAGLKNIQGILEALEPELQKESVCWKHFGAPEPELQKSIWYVGSVLFKNC